MAHTLLPDVGHVGPFREDVSVISTNAKVLLSPGIAASTTHAESCIHRMTESNDSQGA
jgi:hypothetical protein